MDAPDNIPGFLDPLLNHLSSALPPSVYDAVLSLLSYSITFCTSLFHLLKALALSNPTSWDAQTILPPLITVLGAYLALVSFYRTTGWMIRTTFAFVKWGTLLSVLAAGAGYFMGNANANGGNGVDGQFRGIVPTFGGMILDMLNGQDRNVAGGARTSRTSTRSRTQRRKAPRPKAWESWDRHQEWQYNDNAQNQAGDGGSGVQQIMGQIFGAAGRVIRDGGWWEAAKNVVDSALQDPDADAEGERDAGSEGRRQQPPRNAKTKAQSKSSSN
ncbi:uncharacterized protein C8Q71DRAFT_831906 [Rhodofomes roseus]|uniref:Uncharacterized protein n=1 Tax=Rhodofomes roseus TaxID=34475 RepID=A0ABQ8KM81_9APHY|nr:uncharacterized protein C8Q71DRAFT_831906 [Rhodofomes roseus]KAH9839429.1 hypothetical protein C8Q71DRAFT_831906 [Rhodofomes roseus]